MEVFFCRPGSNIEVLERIKLEIKYAKKRVLIAQYFMTEKEVEQLVKECRVEKRVILDGDKGFYSQDPYVVTLGNPKHKSYMHHKFLIIDDILWTGTLNLSQNGSDSNWENMMRINDKEIVDLYISEFKKMFLLGKALAKSTLNPSSFTDPFENISIQFNQEQYFDVSYDAENNILLSHVDEIKSVSLTNSKTRKKSVLPYRLICENCLKKLDTDRLRWCYFSRTPMEHGTYNDISEPEINKNKIYAERHSPLFRRLCYDCLYDYLEDNALLEEYFKPEYFIEDIDPSILKDYEGQWVELKNATIDSVNKFPSGSISITVSKNSEKIEIYIDYRIGNGVADIPTKFNKNDSINAIGISSVFKKKNNDDETVQLKIMNSDDFTLQS